MSVQWQRIAELYEPDAERHGDACARKLGLDCPIEVFAKLFHERREARESARVA